MRLDDLSQQDGGACEVSGCVSKEERRGQLLLQLQPGGLDGVVGGVVMGLGGEVLHLGIEHENGAIEVVVTHERFRESERELHIVSSESVGLQERRDGTGGVFTGLVEVCEGTQEFESFGIERSPLQGLIEVVGGCFVVSAGDFDARECGSTGDGVAQSGGVVETTERGVVLRERFVRESDEQGCAPEPRVFLLDDVQQKQCICGLSVVNERFRSS